MLRNVRYWTGDSQWAGRDGWGRERRRRRRTSMGGHVARIQYAIAEVGAAARLRPNAADSCAEIVAGRSGSVGLEGGREGGRGIVRRRGAV